jgi:sugar lactone lactonase YvrE
MQKRLMLSAAGLAGTLLWAVETKNWVLDHPTDFEKGNLKRLSLRNDGRLRLAPETKELWDAGVPYLWTIVADTKGNVYTATGGPGTEKAKVVRIDGAGKATTLAEIDGAEIHTLALNAKDELFAGTMPDGKVYRVTAAGASVFYDPKAKYIWGLAFDAAGNLYVATGDGGEVHRVTPGGQGRVFFKSDEAHARSIVCAPNGDVIVGTEPGGLVIRVNAAGEGFVLYQSTRKEITSLAYNAKGELFVTGAGGKQNAPYIAPPPPPMQNPPPPGSTVNQAQPTQRIAVAPPSSQMPSNINVPGGSEVYRLDRDGAPLKIWSHATEVAYGIAFDAKGTPWIGTGNKGGIYRVDTPYLATLLTTLAPTQVTALATGRDGLVYAATGNVGKVFRLGPGLEKEGFLESEVLDVGSFTSWGRLRAEGTMPGIAFETRSGNLERPQKNWSNWQALKDGRVQSPAARFLQWRATFRAPAAGAVEPELKLVDVAYRAKNLPPRIEAVEATPQNYKTPAGPTAAVTPAPATLNLPALGRNRQRSSSGSMVVDPGASTMMVNYAKGWMGARWLAVDDNGDTLEFKVEIKGVNETAWKPLKDKLKDRSSSFDCTAYPDGQYQVRVTASDQPDNVPGSGLTDMMVSEAFTIDNSAPVISKITATANGTDLALSFSVKDELALLQSVEYSVNGGEWQWAEPTTKLTDSMEHEYRLTVARPAGGEVVVAVRASDVNDNQAVEKTVVK